MSESVSSAAVVIGIYFCNSSTESVFLMRLLPPVVHCLLYIKGGH